MTIVVPPFDKLCHNLNSTLPILSMISGGGM
jgi:hypothetical protein